MVSKTPINPQIFFKYKRDELKGPFTERQVQEKYNNRLFDGSFPFCFMREGEIPSDDTPFLTLHELRARNGSRTPFCFNSGKEKKRNWKKWKKNKNRESSMSHSSPAKKKFKGENDFPFHSYHNEESHIEVIKGSRRDEDAKDLNDDSKFSVVMREEPNKSLISYEEYMDLCRQEGKFPLLALPRNLIADVFSCLLIKDRMRFRVNKELKGIEEDTKFCVENLTIEEGPRAYEIRTFTILPSHHLRFNVRDHNSCDLIRRIFKNTSIGSLNVILNTVGNLCLDMRQLIKEFKNIGYLTLRFDFKSQAQQKVMYTWGNSNDFLLDVAESYKGLNIHHSKYINTDSLHKVYQKMIEGSTTFRKFECTQFSQLYDVLSRIGIFVDEDFFSNRAIEAFTKVKNGVSFYYIFDRNIEITFSYETRIGDHWSHGCFILEMHESKESLETAKNEEGLIRVRVDQSS